MIEPKAEDLKGRNEFCKFGQKLQVKARIYGQKFTQT
jgi:hypothetical protein